jgi:SAM-dependent methyltransferase
MLSHLQEPAPEIMMAQTISSGAPFAELQIDARSSKAVSELSCEDAKSCGYRDRNDLVCALGSATDRTAWVLTFRVSKVLSAAGISSAELWRQYEPEDIPTKPSLHPTFMTALRNSWANRRILDLGCGDGRLSIALVKEAADGGAALDWVGTDVCNEAVENARQLATCAGFGHVDSHCAGSQQRVSFVTGDVTSIDVTGATSRERVRGLSRRHRCHE